MGNANVWKGFLKTGTFVILLLALPVFAVSAFGSPEADIANPEAIFLDANKAYQKGDFNQAAELYQQLYNAGYLNGNLFYNLGNSYFKLGVKGRAVLFYERAQRLIPGDADLNANLSHALTGVQEGVPDWKQEFMRFLTGMATVEQLAVVSSVWFFILISFVIIWIIRPAFLKDIIEGQKKWWIGIVIGCGIIFLGCFSLGALTYWEQGREHAIAIKADEVRFEPSPTATLYYHLAEGSRVLILEEKENWVKIRRIDGKRGWVNKDCLEII